MSARTLVLLSALLAIACKSPAKETVSETPTTTPAATAPSAPTTKAPGTDPISYSGSFGAKTGYAKIKVGGRDRRVYVYVPATSAAKPALVMAFHGTGSNLDDGAHDAAISELGIREVADANGFIVVAPFSTSDGGVNADHEDGGDGWRFDGDAASNLDLALTRASIQEATRAYGVDTARIYAVGHSNGAFFAYFAAMKLADRFAAFAETSGGMIPCGKRVDCTFARRGATSCSALLSAAPASCKCPVGAAAFPTVKPNGRVPPGFLKHNADDSIVSAAFTCRLAEHLGPRARVSLDGAGDHGPTNDFMAKAWAFLATKSLAD